MGGRRRSGYTLTVIQFGLTLGLAIFGEKLATEIDVPPGGVVLAVVALLFLSVAFTLLQEEVTTSEGVESRSLTALLARIDRLMLRRIATLFPAMLASGSLAALFWILLLDSPDVSCREYPAECGYVWQVNAHNYEVAAFVSGVMAIGAFGLSKRAVVLIVAATFGYTLGASAAIVVIRPDENHIALTLLGWSAYAVSGAVLLLLSVGLSRVPPLRKAVATTYGFLTKER